MMSRYYVFAIPFIFFLGLVFLLLSRLVTESTELPAARLGQAMPEFALPELSDIASLRTQASLPRQAYLLNVWASWCVACVQEHGFLTELAGKGIKIVGLNYKDNAGDARSFLQQYGNPFLFSLSDMQGDLAFDLGVYGAPETFVVGADGHIKYRHVGVLNAEVWASHIQPYFVQSFSVSQGALR